MCVVPSAVSLRITGAQQLDQAQQMIGGLADILFSTFSQTENGSDPRVSFGEPLKHVKTPHGPS